MWKLAVVLLSVIIFVVLLSLGNNIRVLAALTQILITALGAIAIMVLAVGIAPWLNDRG